MVRILNKTYVRVLKKLELKVAMSLGKGFGNTSIESEVMAALGALRNSPKLVVDVGANVGKYSAAILAKNPGCEVHLFEPQKSNAQILQKEFLGRARINQVALSDKSGETLLHADVEGSGLGSLELRKLDHLNIDINHHEKVTTTRFESYWRKELASRIIDLAKLDIEGHELKALLGFGKAINQTRVVQFEFGGTNFEPNT